jgi:hypothetical protein
MSKALKTRSPRASRQPQILTVDDLTGGVDLRRTQSLIGSNRARTLKNWSLEEPGALVVRPGYQAASSVSFGSNPQGGERVYLASTAFTLMAIDGAVYKPSDAWVKGAAVYSTISTGNQVFFPFDRDLVAVMDGANRPRMSTNGTTWLLMGIDAPPTPPSLSSLSTGGLSSGEFEVAYTYKHRGTGHESNGSSGSTLTLTATSGAIQVTATPSTDAKVDAYVWYARHKLPDQESVFRKVSSGSSATIVITSSNWTSNEEIPTNHDVPATGLKFATIWKNRWWAPDGTVGNRLRFSEIFQSQTWPATYYIDIPFRKGDSISAVQDLGDTLLVHGQSGIFLIIGQTSLDFEVRPSAGADSGAFGQRAVGRVEQSATHASADDVTSFDGASDRSLAFDIQAAWRDLVSHTASVDLARVATIYDPFRKEFRISVPRVYPTAARGEWILNLDRTRENDGAPAWTSTDRDIAFYIHWNGNEPSAGNRGRIFSVPSTGGSVFEENIGTSANSSNLTAEYEGPALSLGLHRARVLDLHVEYEPHSGAFTAETITDGISQGGIALSIGSNLATYDTATYDTDAYAGAGRRKAYTPLPLSAEGRTVVFMGTYTGQERFKVFTYSYGISPESMPSRFSE